VGQVIIDPITGLAISTSSWTPQQDLQSAANCAAGGGLYAGNGVCNAPSGGALYTDQLAAIAANEAANPSCPWYCLPFLTYGASSPCFSCQTGVATAGGIPVWGWIGIGLGAALLILPKVFSK
jgi:hypothetical protein